MRKFLFFSLALGCAANSIAQPVQKRDISDPVKLSDLIEEHKRSSRPVGREEREKDREERNGEGRDYHFDRWVWYWKSHTDENGYLVSPMKTWQEWQAWKEQKSRTAALAKTTANESDWKFHGPASSGGGYEGLGRINVVAFHPTDSNTFIAGSAGGGAWRTTNGGISWTSITDQLPVLGVSDIDYNPKNPDVIYLCTGDRDASDTYSIGVLKSTDGGATWNATGLVWTVNQFRLTNDLLVNPIDTSRLILATSQGIYRSSDGGAAWNLVQNGSYRQLLYHPTDTAIVYATGGNGGGEQIFRSGDGGATWTQVTSFAGVVRVKMAVTPANPLVVKAVAAKSVDNGLEGIYSSSDTGHTFVPVLTDPSCDNNILGHSPTLQPGNCGGQGWYDLCIAISPTDADRVFVGGVNTWQSIDGGSTWDILNQWYNGLPGIKVVHADKHFMAFNPTQAFTLYECNDGGLYRTSNPQSQLWNDLTNGMGITQFYRNAVSSTAPFVLGGSQDNGTKRLTIATGVATAVTGGDGMNCEIDPVQSNIYYGATQYGNIRRFAPASAGGNSTISDNIPGNPFGAWITPYIIHPANRSILLAGYQEIYISGDRGDTWNSIAPPLGTADLERLAAAGNDPAASSGESYIYALYSSNTLRYSSNAGGSWNALSGAGANMTDIIVDPKDSTHIWATMGGYSANNKVSERRIGDAFWTPRSAGLPNVPVLCITIDSSNGTLYIGTDVGVFFKDTSMNQWEAYNTGLPSTEVTDLGINYTTNEIWASTYGRGMWYSPRHLTSEPPVGIGQSPLALDVIRISPNPSNGSFSVQTTNPGFLGQKVSMRLVDLSGRTVWQEKGAFDGNGNLHVHADGIARSTYFFEVISDKGAIARAKMILMP